MSTRFAVARLFLLENDWESRRRIARKHPDLLSEDIFGALVILGDENDLSHSAQGCILALKLARAIGLEEAFDLIVRVLDLQSEMSVDPSRVAELDEVYGAIFKAIGPEFDGDYFTLINVELARGYLAWKGAQRDQHLRRAIQLFQSALANRAGSGTNFDVAHVWNDCGVAYSQLQTGRPADNRKQACLCFERALNNLSPDRIVDRNLFGANLAAATHEQQSGEVRFPEQQMDSFKELLDPEDSRDDPAGYAVRLVNAGISLCRLQQGDLAAQRHHALDCFQRAVELLRKHEPHSAVFGQALHHLGMTWAELPAADPQDNLQRAMRCFEEALVPGVQNDPHLHAEILLSLGNVYPDLAPVNSCKHIDRAVGLYEKALELVDAQDDPGLFSRLHNALGNALLRFGKAPPPLLPNLSLSRRLFMTVFNAMDSWSGRPFVTSALAHYEESLKTGQSIESPLALAQTRSNVGLCHVRLAGGKLNAHARQALAAFAQALEVFSPELFPRECRDTNRHVADLNRDLGRWNEAL
ncbi:MAG: hypothetical protein ACKVX9_13955 [Blastocatellia bacterium]